MVNMANIERSNIIMTKLKSAITITLGDQAENHKGMQIIGKMADCGFTNEELERAKNIFEQEGCSCEFVDLKERLISTWKNEDLIEIEDASVLIVRGAVTHILSKVGFDADYIFEEQANLDVDRKAFMYGRVVEKSARYNLCFDDTEQEPDYENKKGRIIPYNDVPLTRYVRHMLPVYLGEKARNLAGEGNYYFDSSKCGIGWHGDSERKRVVAMRLGASIPLAYQWHYRGKRIGDTIMFADVNHGDLYVMSEKASGWDWKRKLKPTLRHAAGCDKFLQFKKDD
jgi:hypothetical protein